MAKKVKIETMADLSDNLGADIIAALNTKFKGGHKAAYFLTDTNTTDVTEWISTSCAMLDLAISNRPNGGIPVGKITEIYGQSASGKSLLAAHILANTQKKGGIAVYIDTESAVSSDFLQAIGVDISKMMYCPIETIEDCMEAIETIITNVKAKYPNKLVTIVLDSIMGATTKVELESDYDKDGWSTTKAIVLSKSMRKLTNMIGRERICLVMTNQLREKLGVTWGNNTTTAGGKAVGYHSSVRLRLADVGKIEGVFNDVKSIIGKKTKVTVDKNRLGPPLRSVTYDIYFQSGIDDAGSWLETLKLLSLVQQKGAWYQYDIVDESTGEIDTIKFLSKDFEGLLENNPTLKEHIYKTICDKYIVKYDSNEIGIDDVSVVAIEDDVE
jgi:recombination protein RecA